MLPILPCPVPIGPIHSPGHCCPETRRWGSRSCRGKKRKVGRYGMACHPPESLHWFELQREWVRSKNQQEHLERIHERLGTSQDSVFRTQLMKRSSDPRCRSCVCTRETGLSEPDSLVQTLVTSWGGGVVVTCHQAATVAVEVVRPERDKIRTADMFGLQEHVWDPFGVSWRK